MTNKVRKHAALGTVTPTSDNSETVTLVCVRQQQPLTSNTPQKAIYIAKGSCSRRIGGNKVNNPSNKTSEFFPGDSETSNLLWQYVQSLTPDTITQLSKPTSAEVFQVMERNIVGLLGNLPSEHFEVNITTSRENLGRLLASAMISGYFLRNAEQRMNFETALLGTDANHSEDLE